MSFNTGIVILAAGKGTRMKSAIPKVLHPLAGKPLLSHVIDTAEALNPQKICIVYGHEGEKLQQAFSEKPHLDWAEQSPQLGTGHAVQQAIEHVNDTQHTLILYGDVPLISRLTLEQLLQQVTDNSLGLLTAFVDQANGYGRILRNEADEVVGIIEEKDANQQQKQINEINTGIMALPTVKLQQWLKMLKNDNAQGEYYLTDIIALAVKEGVKVIAMQPEHLQEILGVNSRRQLSELERYVQIQRAYDLMDQGVTIKDPGRIDIRGNITVGRDIIIDVDVVLEGNINIGDNVVIEPFCHLRNCEFGRGTHIYSHTVLEDCKTGDNCSIGPFTRVRPGTVLNDQAKLGNFVEVKKSTIGNGSKVNHLSYIGDTEVGTGVNIGAGTITCNYDGANKYKTVIEDGAFIGSDTQLIAPVRIGKNATIGAGSTITKDAPDNKLTLSRSKQIQVENWQRPVKKK